MPAIPSWTSAGAFGIARTTRAPSGSRDSIAAVVTPAATERSVCSGDDDGAISASTPTMSCGLTARMTSRAPAIAAALSAVVSTP